jgi:putative hemolysin
LESFSITSFFYNSNYSFLAISFNNSSIVLICIVFILLGLLFFISGAEVALFSLNYKDLSVLKTKQDEDAKRVVTFLENPKGLLGSLTIASVVLTIAIIAISNFVIDSFLPSSIHWALSLLIKVGIIGSIILFLGNIFPKVWASQNKIRFALRSSLIVEAVYLLFGNISKPLIQVSNTLDSKFGNDDKQRMDGELLDYAIDKLPDNEASKEEKQILKEIRKFGNTTVKQIMRPRLDVSGINFTDTMPNVIRQVEELHYSRIPIYENTLDDLKGILYTKDLLPHIHQTEDYNWQQLIKPCVFVHEQKLIEDLLQEFRTKKIHIAVVVDEFGGTSGIVTLEDIVEEIIGEIKDEFDEEDGADTQINENEFVFDGKIMINDMCKKMQVNTETFDEVKGESDSLGGLVLELAKDIPAVGETIVCGDFTFTIEEVEKNRVKKVKVKVQQ